MGARSEGRGVTPRNLIDLQRQHAVTIMGDQARRLLAEGYAVEADRVLDELADRIRAWGING